MNKKGVFLGRFCPLHLGHEHTINKMIDLCGWENSLIIIGSSNTPISIRNFFSYVERRSFIKKVFPLIRVVGLPDYHGDDWFIALDDILISAKISPYENTVYFGGSEEDVNFFIGSQREICIVNRFDGSAPKSSGSEIRDCLIHKRSLSGLVDPGIIDVVNETFHKKWPDFLKI